MLCIHSYYALVMGQEYLVNSQITDSHRPKYLVINRKQLKIIAALWGILHVKSELIKRMKLKTQKKWSTWVLFYGQQSLQNSKNYNLDIENFEKLLIFQRLNYYHFLIFFSDFCPKKELKLATFCYVLCFILFINLLFTCRNPHSALEYASYFLLITSP